MATVVRSAASGARNPTAGSGKANARLGMDAPRSEGGGESPRGSVAARGENREPPPPRPRSPHRGRRGSACSSSPRDSSNSPGACSRTRARSGSRAGFVSSSAPSFSPVRGRPPIPRRSPRSEPCWPSWARSCSCCPARASRQSPAGASDSRPRPCGSPRWRRSCSAPGFPLRRRGAGLIRTQTPARPA